MALIERFVVVATQFVVDSAASLTEGMLVKLNSSGNVVLATGAASEYAIGICADTKSTSTPGIPSTNDAVIGSNGGATSKFVNRISDGYDETKASGKMTVYSAGGEFDTNQYDTSLSYTVGTPLYVKSDGTLTNSASSSGQIVALCLKAPTALDSGVPGLDVNGSMTLGNFMRIKLVI